MNAPIADMPPLTIQPIRPMFLSGGMQNCEFAEWLMVPFLFTAFTP